MGIAPGIVTMASSLGFVMNINTVVFHEGILSPAGEITGCILYVIVPYGSVASYIACVYGCFVTHKAAFFHKEMIANDSGNTVAQARSAGIIHRIADVHLIEKIPAVCPRRHLLKGIAAPVMPKPEKGAGAKIAVGKLYSHSGGTLAANGFSVA